MYVRNAEAENHNGRYTFAPRYGVSHWFWVFSPGPGIVSHEPNTCNATIISRDGVEMFFDRSKFVVALLPEMLQNASCKN